MTVVFLADSIWFFCSSSISSYIGNTYRQYSSNFSSTSTGSKTRLDSLNKTFIHSGSSSVIRFSNMKSVFAVWRKFWAGFLLKCNFHWKEYLIFYFLCYYYRLRGEFGELCRCWLTIIVLWSLEDLLNNSFFKELVIPALPPAQGSYL